MPSGFAIDPATLIGTVYGRLTIVGAVRVSGKRRDILCDCKCACGSLKKISLWTMKYGETVSCGCYQRELHTKHGMYGTRVHNSWRGIKDRCMNPKHIRYWDYGGRGIKVCDRWLESFENFLADMGMPPTARHSIDRIDNDKGYSPDNCRWATPKEQGRNQRRAIILEMDGETKHIAEWCEIYGANPNIVGRRVKRGWSLKKALTHPPCQGQTIKGRAS